jgi:hypothetical protein
MGPRFRLAPSLIAGLVAVLAAGAGHAQSGTTATSRTDASASISAPVAIGVTQNLSFNISQQTLNTGLTITSSTVNGLNANFALTGAQTASVSIPATFEVVRIGGVETITVRTIGAVGGITAAGATGAGAATVTGIPGSGPVTGVVAGGIFANPVNVVGQLDSGVLSFSVGGAVTLASNLAPGQYQGVLTVIAQYN